MLIKNSTYSSFWSFCKITDLFKTHTFNNV